MVSLARTSDTVEGHAVLKEVLGRLIDEIGDVRAAVAFIVEHPPSSPRITSEQAVRDYGSDCADAFNRAYAARDLRLVLAALMVDVARVPLARPTPAEDAAQAVQDVIRMLGLDAPDRGAVRVVSPQRESAERRAFKRDRARLWLLLAERDGLDCALAGCDASPEHLTIDHRIPLSRGGTNDLANLHFLCRPHNTDKGIRTWDEYLAAVAA